MGSPLAAADPDEPLTPAGRLFLQKEMNQVIHCVLGMKHPINAEEVKVTVKDSPMLKHPRFHSLMVRDRHGREHWRRTQVDINRHIIVIDEPINGSSSVAKESSGPEFNRSELDSENAVNEYLADLAMSTGLSFDKPLWEIHLLLAHNCAVFRLHHALGDGISLMSMFLASCRRTDDPAALPSLAGVKKKRVGERKSFVNRVWMVLEMVWFSVVYALQFMLRSLWVRDKKTAVSGGEGTELWPRKLATARFLLEDMKVVKKAVPDATINDVLFGIISAGLFRYMEFRSSDALKEGDQVTGVAMVNLRKQPGLQELADMMKGNPGLRWGNKFGIILLPLHYNKSSDPLEYLRRTKAMIDRKKNSAEAQFSYKIGDLVMSYLGAKVASILNYRIVCNTTFTLSNVLGPQEEIAIAGNPITYMRANSSSLPHALTMHMVSYAGKADMQILVAKDIIPEPGVLAKCFQDALLEMKEAALAIPKN